jgi:hypothetical protein
MKHLQHLLLAACLSVAVLPVSPAAAYDQPLGLNLGGTSFLDGIPPAGPGLYFQEYIQYYTADTFANAPRNPLGVGPASDAQVDAWISLNQLIYQSDQKVLFGGKWGLNVIVPVPYIDADDRNGILTDNAGGLGDVYVGPFLQWDPIMGKNGPVFVHRVELTTIWPTGKYDDEKALNPGSNYFSFNPYWAATWFALPKVELSTRVHYLWNDENEDPFIGSGATDSTQAGQAWFANFAASYEVLPKQLRVGVNGYYLKQFESSEVDGDKMGLKEEVFAIGPGALWSFSQHTHLFFNAYFESDTEARPEGERFYLRLVHHFQ